MIVGYTMLHYGCDYLASALTSLRDYVDKHVILYSPTPTFGQHTDLPCPDSREDLYSSARALLGKKLAWFDGLPQGHATVQELFPDASLILEVDADEIWTPALAAQVLRAHRLGYLISNRYRVPMIHHWRSFNYICRDGSGPIRICVPGAEDGEKFYPTDRWMHHFGYARSVEDTRYKIATSAHRGEWREGWLEDVFLGFPDRLLDLHPVSVGMWNAEPYDRRQLPDFMRLHPWFNQEVIA